MATYADRGGGSACGVWGDLHDGRLTGLSPDTLVLSAETWSYQVHLFEQYKQTHGRWRHYISACIFQTPNSRLSPSNETRRTWS